MFHKVIVIICVVLLSLEQRSSADAAAAADQGLAQSPEISVWGPGLGWPTVGWVFDSPRTALSCKEEGVYPHPEDCTRFYKCTSILGGSDKYSYLVFKCAIGERFSKNGKGEAACIPGTCTSQYLESSATATSVSSSISGNPVCIAEGRYPDSKDCGQYIDCIRHNDGKLIAHKQSCFGNSFNPSSQTCVSPHKVNGCATHQYRSLRSNTIEYPHLQKICSNHRNGYICGDCQTLIMCINSIGYPMPCEDGSACSMAKEAFSGGVCHPNISDACNCTVQDSLKIDLYDPTKFLNCSSGETVVEKCPEGSVFSIDTQNCETLRNSCSTSGRGTFSSSNDCSQYYSCSLSTNGWAQKWFTCPRNEMYNADTSQCEDPCKWHYGNFTCKAEGRFHNPINCSTYYECFVNPMDKEKFIQIISACPDTYEWDQDVGQCMARGTSKNKCIPLSPKPNTCSIPTKQCRYIALAACVYEHEFCECQDDMEVFPFQCTPCAEGHASNKTGCFPVCSKLICGKNEICFDEHGQAPGTCTCAPGYIREGGLCKALCSNMTCGDNETCADEDGQAPGACTCDQGYAREGGQCKDMCVSAGGVHISNQCLVFNSTTLTWLAAMLACAAKGQQLAILQDTNITALAEYMTNNSYSWHMVGASDEGSEGKWFWMDGRPVGDGMKWSSHSGTSGPTRSGNCMEYLPNNGMDPHSCTSGPQPYICSLDTTKPQPAYKDSENGLMRSAISPKQCPDDSFEVNNECFFIPNEDFKTWTNAQAFCRSQGGFLAEPNYIVDFLEALANINSGYNYWIGKAKPEDERMWSWNFNIGKIDDAKHWSSGALTAGSGIEEDKGCQLVMRGEQLPLYKAHCNDFHLFVCEKN